MSSVNCRGDADWFASESRDEAVVPLVPGLLSLIVGWAFEGSCGHRVGYGDAHAGSWIVRQSPVEAGGRRISRPPASSRRTTWPRRQARDLAPRLLTAWFHVTRMWMTSLSSRHLGGAARWLVRMET